MGGLGLWWRRPAGTRRHSLQALLLHVRRQGTAAHDAGSAVREWPAFDRFDVRLDPALHDPRTASATARPTAAPGQLSVQSSAYGFQAPIRLLLRIRRRVWRRSTATERGRWVPGSPQSGEPVDPRAT